MPTNDSFNPEHLPLFLADERSQQSSGKTWNKSVLSPSVLGAGVWIAAATALIVALLSAGIPARVVAGLTASITDVTASLVNKPTLEPAAEPSPPAIQDSADVQALPPTEGDAPAREEIAAVSEPADQPQTASSEPASESLFSQFEAWAAEKEARAQLERAQPVQDAPASASETPVQAVQKPPAEVAKDEPAPRRSIQKRRHARDVQDAHAEARPAHDHRKKVRRTHHSGAAAAPPQDIRAQEQVEAVQSPPPPLLPIFGLGNNGQ